MRRHKDATERRKFIDDIRARQANILWPDAVRNARSVDAYLWKGSAGAPLVQRIGAWLIGLCFLLLGSEFLIRALQYRDWFPLLFAIAFILLGTKIVLNGFKKQNHKIKPQ